MAAQAFKKSRNSKQTTLRIQALCLVTMAVIVSLCMSFSTVSASNRSLADQNSLLTPRSYGSRGARHSVAGGDHSAARGGAHSRVVRSLGGDPGALSSNASRINYLGSAASIPPHQQRKVTRDSQSKRFAYLEESRSKIPTTKTSYKRGRVVTTDRYFSDSNQYLEDRDSPSNQYLADRDSPSGSDSERSSFANNWKESRLIPRGRQISYKVGRVGSAEYRHHSWDLKFNYQCEGREAGADAMEPNLGNPIVQQRRIKYIGEELSQSYLRKEFYGMRLTFWCHELSIHSSVDTSTQVGSETHFALFTIVAGETASTVTIRVSGVRKWNNNGEVRKWNNNGEAIQHPVLPNIKDGKYRRQESWVVEAIYETDQGYKVKFDCTCPPRRPWAWKPAAHVEAERLKYERSGDPMEMRLAFEYCAQRIVEFCGVEVGSSADIEIEEMRSNHWRHKLRFLMEDFSALNRTVKFSISNKE